VAEALPEVSAQETIMTVSLWTDRIDASSVADRALTVAARLWFLTAVAGQLIFAAYVVGFYGGSAVRGDMAAWNRVMPRGHVPGDSMGNFVVALHLLLAVVIILGGPLQLIPGMRRRAPRFHRWNGRVYILAVLATSIAALCMIWIRGAGGDLVQHLGGTLNAALVMIFAVLAVRHAIARDRATHRRWALRLYIAVSASWFFRVGLMLWVVLNEGPRGFDPETFTGPVLSFLAFANSLLPLAILEIYLRIADTNGRFAMATGLLLLTVAMGVGIFAAAALMWLPHI
jgi:uncharacterized membrane protein